MTATKQAGPGSKNSTNLYSKVAGKILSESLHVKKGESITVETWTNGLPFARQVVVEARRIGAIPVLILEDEDAYMDSLKNMPKDVLGAMGKHESNLLSGTDAYVFIPGPPIGAYFLKSTNEERTASTSYSSSWYEAAERAKLRGVRLSFGYVGRDLARLLGKSTEQIVGQLLRASLEADFASIKRKAKQISEYLLDNTRCTVSSSDGSTKLDFEVKGEAEVEDAIVDDADVSNGYNMTYVPPGFVAKSVNSSSVSGKVKLSSFVTRAGLVKDATLEFESGKLSKWESKTSIDKLNMLIEAVPNDSRKLGMVTIGLNPAMRYGYGQDRFVEGAIGVRIHNFSAVVQKGSLLAGGTKIVDGGKLAR